MKKVSILTRNITCAFDSSLVMACRTHLRKVPFISLYCGNPLPCLCLVWGKVVKRQVLFTFDEFVVITAIYTAMIISHNCVVSPLKTLVTQTFRMKGCPSSFVLVQHATQDGRTWYQSILRFHWHIAKRAASIGLCCLSTKVLFYYLTTVAYLLCVLLE